MSMVTCSHFDLDVLYTRRNFPSSSSLVMQVRVSFRIFIGGGGESKRDNCQVKCECVGCEYYSNTSSVFVQNFSVARDIIVLIN